MMGVISGLPARLGLSPQAFRPRPAGAGDAGPPRQPAGRGCSTRRVRRSDVLFSGERMFWGNDRLMLLEAALGGKAMPETRR